MNEIGWFVAGVEFVVILACGWVILYAINWSKWAIKRIEEASKRIERDGREIEEYRRRREKDAEEISEFRENAVTLYEAAGLDEYAKFMDVVRLIKKHRQDSLDFEAAKERASKIFNPEQGV